MTDENIVDLFLAKFKTSPKEKQEGLVKYLIQSTYNQDQIVNYLNGKKITELNSFIKDYMTDLSLAAMPVSGIYVIQVSSEFLNIKKKFVSF